MSPWTTQAGRHVIYTRPKFSIEQIDNAGKALLAPDGADPTPGQKDLEVIHNWRAAHHYPLNSICVVLRQRARRVRAPALISQRLKRFESIVKKLNLRPWITLSQMQDIGGCRAVVNSLDEVSRLRDDYRTSPGSHRFKQENDYIQKPKKDGYRGVHLIYYYVGRAKRARAYAAKNMQVEVQMRTPLQHYWATAVETAEAFSRESLKSRRQNESITGWREFFALAASCFAYEEGTPMVPGQPATIDATVSRLKDVESAGYYLNALESYKVSVSAISQYVTQARRSRFFLLELDPELRVVRIRDFRATQQPKATRAYDRSEQQALFSDVQNVLVQVNQLAELQRLYPNYYADTTEFVARIRRIVA